MQNTKHNTPKGQNMITLYLTTPYHPPYMLRTNCSSLAPLLYSKHGNYITESPVPVAHTITAVSMASSADASSGVSRKLSSPISYEITYNDSQFITSSPLLAIEDILYKHRSFDPAVFALHGAAVEHDGRACLFLGSTTSGKTTLTSFLVSRGFGYITDDCILLHRNTYMIHPYTTPLHLRHGGLTILNQYGLYPEPLEQIDDTSFPRYVHTPKNCITTPLPLGKIFFIRRTKQEDSTQKQNNTDYNNHIEAMDITKRMTSLMKAPIIDYSVDTCYLQFIAGLSKVPCYQLFYNDMNYVMEVLRNG